MASIRVVAKRLSSFSGSLSLTVQSTIIRSTPCAQTVLNCGLCSSTGPLPNLTEAQLKKIEETDTFYRTRHEHIEANIADDSQRDEVRRRRMIYRSKQRGWLEADIIMGSWAVENVPKLSSSDLDDYELLLKEETIDIFNFITEKDEIPDRLKGMYYLNTSHIEKERNKLY